jgi:Adenylate and Guanylate cyclase catalytic domain
MSCSLFLISFYLNRLFAPTERDPSQVFTLLETIYQVFDNVAEQYDVFKVETIGDSYVAGKILCFFLYKFEYHSCGVIFFRAQIFF